MQRFIRYCGTHTPCVRSNSSRRRSIVDTIQQLDQESSLTFHQCQPTAANTEELKMIGRISRQRHYTTLIFSNVLPNISASAACVRTKSIIDGLARGLQDNEDGVNDNVDDDDGTATDVDHRLNNHEVYYLTPATTAAAATVPVTDQNNNSDTSSCHDEQTVSTHTNFHIVHLPPNRTDLFRKTVTTLFNNRKQPQEQHVPDLVVFDRFYMEETYSCQIWKQYGVHNVPPLILDMQDFHSLRYGRQRIVTQWDIDNNNNSHNYRSVGGLLYQPISHYGTVNTKDENEKGYDPFGCLDDVIQYYPSIGDTYDDDRLLRELASIQRCDLTMVCSPHEMELLRTIYEIPQEKLCLASFFVNNDTSNNKGDDHDVHDNDDDGQRFTNGVPSSSSVITVPTDDERNNHDSGDNPSSIEFVFCGGFKHAPNVDAVNTVVNYIWPRIRKQMMDSATLHIYGAFCPSTFQAYHNKHSTTTGIYVHGYKEILSDVFLGHPTGRIQRVGTKQSFWSSDDIHIPHNTVPARRSILLAPLRFGAGIKGKIIDAWTFGMPVVTTSIGSEGMTGTSSSVSSDPVFGGRITNTMDDFCQSAIDLATDTQAYRKAQRDGKFLLQTLFNSKHNWKEVQNRLRSLLPDKRGSRNNLIDRRKRDYTRALLWHQTTRSTEYFSRWIELKESIKQDREE
jgi:hypothetical protein